MLFKLNSVYSSIEGEGVHVGTPTIFVRFQGCSIQCITCDTMESWKYNWGVKFTYDDLLEEILSYKGIKRVSFTGGNPLEQDIELLFFLKKDLLKKGYIVNFEFPGVSDASYLKIYNDKNDAIYTLGSLLENATLSLDIKTPSSGKFEESFSSVVEDYLKPKVFQNCLNSQIKMVVDSEDDINAIIKVINFLKDFREKEFENLDFTFFPQLVITPCWKQNIDKVNLQIIEKTFTELCSSEILNSLNVRIITQQHKILYSGKNRGNV